MSEIVSIIPKNLVDVLKDLAKNVLSDKPDNIYSYACEYFENRLVERDGSLNKDYEFFDESDKYFSKNSEKYILCVKNTTKKQSSEIFPKSSNKILKSCNAVSLPTHVNDEENNELAKDDHRLMIYTSLYENTTNFVRPEYDATLNSFNIKKHYTYNLSDNKRQPKTTSLYYLCQYNQICGNNQYVNDIRDLKRALKARSRLNIIKRKEKENNKYKKNIKIKLEDILTVLRGKNCKKLIINQNLRKNINFKQCTNISNAIKKRKQIVVSSKPSDNSLLHNDIGNKIWISLHKDEKLFKILELKRLSFPEYIQWIFKINKNNPKEHIMLMRDLVREKNKNSISGENMTSSSDCLKLIEILDIITKYGMKETNLQISLKKNIQNKKWIIGNQEAITISSPHYKNVTDLRFIYDNHQIISVNGNIFILYEKTKNYIQFIFESLVNWYNQNCALKTVCELNINEENLRMWNVNNIELHIIIRDEKITRNILNMKQLRPGADVENKMNNHKRKLWSCKRSFSIELTDAFYKNTIETEDILLQDTKNLPVNKNFPPNFETPEILCEYKVKKDVYTISEIPKNLPPMNEIKKNILCIIIQDDKFKNILDIALLTNKNDIRNTSDNFLQNNGNKSICLKEEDSTNLTKSNDIAKSIVSEFNGTENTKRKNIEVNENIPKPNLLVANQNYLLTNILYMEHSQILNAIRLIKSYSQNQTKSMVIVKSDNIKICTLEIFYKYVIKRQNSKESNIYKDLPANNGINNDDLVIAIHTLSGLISELSNKNIEIDDRTLWLADRSICTDIPM